MSKRCLLIVTMIFSVFVAMMAANNDKFTLVIDPGHGGKDAGALGAKSKEKNINLNVALAFGRYVERNCPDVKVIYTRKTDVFIPLNERANIANRNKADLFISVHTNALPNGKVARGFEVYTLGMHRAADNLEVAKRENSAILVENDYKQHYEDFDPNSSESYIIFEFMQDKNMAKSVELAKMIQKDACETAQRVNKGVHQAGFLVLRATSMPSCLIELGFITTQDEENYLNSSAGIDALGKGIYKAFLRYKRKYHKGITVPYAADPTEEVNIPSVVPPREENTAKQEKRKPEKEQTVAAVKQKQPEQEAQPRISGLMDTSENTAEVTSTTEPVFKVQILASDRQLRLSDRQFKGEKNIFYFQEGNMYKYTIGASTNYNEIYQLRKKLLEKFPQAFIIAFKNDRKMDVQQAIREYRAKRSR